MNVSFRYGPCLSNRCFAALDEKDETGFAGALIHGATLPELTPVCGAFLRIERSQVVNEALQYYLYKWGGESMALWQQFTRRRKNQE
jgi:hypothetical protein